ncbi:hypothetical protein OAA55_00460 [bacterium]|nr:hypothetical protein [bacterium]
MTPLFSKYRFLVSLVILLGKIVSFKPFKLILRKYTNVSKKQILADLVVHHILCFFIRLLYPTQHILCEENASMPSSFNWIIDPIDGSSSYRHNFSGYVIQLCHLDDSNNFLFSLIYAPSLNMLFSYHHVKGFSVPSPAENLRLNIYTLVDNYPSPQGVALQLSSHFNLKYIESGSISLKILLVGLGLADLFVKDVVVRDWDIAPTMPFCRLFKIKLTTFDLAEFRVGPYFEKKGIIAFHSSLSTTASNMINQIKRFPE